MQRLVTLALAGVLAGTVACSSDTGISPDSSTTTEEALGYRGENRTPGSLSLEKIGEYVGGGSGAAEITAYDAGTKRLFVVNGALGTVDVLDLSNPAAPVRVATISGAQFGAGINSVDANDGVVAVAIEATVRQNPGTVAFYDAKTLELLSSATVGALPDMVVFTRQGRQLLVANEGEPNAEYTNDPEGSVSIIDVRKGRNPQVRTARFTRFNGRESQLRARGIRIFGPNATAAQDFEPEYIAIDEADDAAYVTLQENNAVAVIDIKSATVRRLVPLGYKDHRLARNAFDASDRDGAANGPLINIRPYPVFGMYQPDAIASYRYRGQTYFVTANEGDAREYTGAPGFLEEVTVGATSVVLNPTVFTDAACGGVPCKSNMALGRLLITNQLGRDPVTGTYDALYVFGGRSFSIYSEFGRQVYDSGDEFERRTTALPNVAFNANNTGNALDNRSDNKGPEPEGVVLGRFGAKTFAFIGLERVGGVMVYDITNPTSPSFTTYINTRNGGTGDLGPEGLAFIEAKDSPNGKPLLVVGNELSGTTAVLQINLQ